MRGETGRTFGSGVAWGTRGRHSRAGRCGGWTGGGRGPGLLRAGPRCSRVGYPLVPGNREKLRPRRCSLRCLPPTRGTARTLEAVLLPLLPPAPPSPHSWPEAVGVGPEPLRHAPSSPPSHSPRLRRARRAAAPGRTPSCYRLIPPKTSSSSSCKAQGAVEVVQKSVGIVGGRRSPRTRLYGIQPPRPPAVFPGLLT